MLTATVDQPGAVTDFQYRRAAYDLTTARVLSEHMLPVQDDMDFLGGIGRSFKISCQL